MPNRIIKETICTSEEIDGLTAEQEVFFYRIMVNVDDYGLLDARLKLLASKCYPLKSIDIKKIHSMLAALESVGLIRLYQVDGLPYLAIAKWAEHQQIRAKRPKYPAPEGFSDIGCYQMQSNVTVIQSNPNPIQSESNLNPKKTHGTKNSIRIPDGFTPNEHGIAYAKERHLNVKAEIESFVNHHEAKGTTYKDWQAGWRTWCDKAVSFGRSAKANKPATKTAAAFNSYTTIFPQEEINDGRVIDVTPRLG